MRIHPLHLACSALCLVAAPIPTNPPSDAQSAPDREAFVAAARQARGEAGARAAAFLWEGMPPRDRAALDRAFLLENLELALASRERFPWGKGIPEERFLNDVLPYACLDEPRDPWRAQLLALAAPLVKDCRTAGEAAQALNRELFKRVNVHYNTGRKRPNQSVRESLAQGRATCTGLSILLAEACRAVGIPARVAGIAQWTNKEGNHTWVEVWDGGWHFLGADEYDAKGLDRGWFTEDASHGVAGSPEHAIHASSWKREGLSFPLAWNPGDASVAAVDVTSRYAAAVVPTPAQVFLRVTEGGARIVVAAELRDGSGEFLGSGETRAGSADLNDMPAFPVPGAGPFWLRLRRGGEMRESPLALSACGTTTLDLAWEKLAPVPAAVREVEAWLAQPAATRGPAPRVDLDRALALRVQGLVWGELRRRRAPEAAREMEKREISRDGLTLKWMETSFGEAPAGGHSLWISMHGGGEAPAELNDQQWKNQLALYKPGEGIYVAPRAPTNTWNMWHQSHIDPMFDRLIADYVATRGVNPDRVYLMGYSAGGDGAYQLAPRMADRLAAASMMAGHPNDASPLSLRNLPFYIFAGGEDAAFNRNRIAAEWGEKLDALRKADPGGYVHKATVYPGLGHWMNRKDAEVLPWMAEARRQPWPSTVVWRQGFVPTDRFYWLEVPAGSGKAGQVIRATVEGQTIRLESGDIHRVTLRLSDALVDLDRPVCVKAGERILFQGMVKRTLGAMVRSLEEREDPGSIAQGMLEVEI